jgi:hypothetical protein
MMNSAITQIEAAVHKPHRLVVETASTYECGLEWSRARVGVLACNYVAALSETNRLFMVFVRSLQLHFVGTPF